MKRWLTITLVILGILILLYLVRHPVLRSIGSFLVVKDAPQKTEVMFVLSGGAFERGSEATELFKEGYSPRIICTGANKDFGVLPLGIDIYECEMTRMAVIHSIKDSSLVDTLCRGTSTYEERNAILEYCRQRGIKSCTIVTSPFHTRRVAWLFRKVFRKNGIAVNIASGKPHQYNPEEWWKNEYGVIDVNNEYVKIFYYFFKYGYNEPRLNK